MKTKVKAQFATDHGTVQGYAYIDIHEMNRIMDEDAANELSATFTLEQWQFIIDVMSNEYTEFHSLNDPARHEYNAIISEIGKLHESLEANEVE